LQLCLKASFLPVVRYSEMWLMAAVFQCPLLENVLFPDTIWHPLATKCFTGISLQTVPDDESYCP